MVYKLTDKLLADEVLNYLDHHSGESAGGRWVLLEPELSAITGTFALYLELRDFGCLATQLGANLVSNTDSHRQLQVATHCHEWFEPAVNRWITAIKSRALQRIRNAWRIGIYDQISNNTLSAY